MVRDEGAGVDAGAAGDVEQPATSVDRRSLGHGRTEDEAAGIHRGGEGGREFVGEHRFAPRLLVLIAAPVGGLVGLQDDDEILHHRAILERGVVGPEEGRRGADEVFAAELGGGVDAVLEREEAVGDEERQHDVGRSAVRAELAADRGEVRGLGGQLGEEVELRDRGGDEVDGVQAVAEAVEAQRVGGGGAGQVEGGHGRGLHDDSPRGENHPFCCAYLAFFLSAFFFLPASSSVPGLPA